MDCSSKPIILYDGVCGLCNGFNRFILKWDSGDCFRFASLQGSFARQILVRHKISPAALNTMFVLFDHAHPEERLLSQSDAVIYVLHSLAGSWRVVGSVLRVLPKTIRDKAYDLIARNRYHLFGKYDACPIPSAEHRERFLDL
jgi:predicted DCC family thiol-disulfide oxidoreductase YuxK